MVHLCCFRRFLRSFLFSFHPFIMLVAACVFLSLPCEIKAEPGAALSSPSSKQKLKIASLKDTSPLNAEARDDGEVEHLTIVMVGDTGFAPSRAKPLPDRVYKYGRKLTFSETTKKIRQHIKADLTFANIETVISDQQDLVPRSKKYNFVTHPNGIAHLVDIGFNLFSMANNHSFDYGARGIRESLRHVTPLLKKGLLAHAGIGLTRQEAAATPVVETKAMRVAFGAIGIGANGGGIQRATSKRPGQLSLSMKQDQQLLASNFASADADLRLLSVHHGPERKIRPSRYEVAMLRKLVAKTGADVMIGHHAHVARGLELRNGRLLVYGLGNFNHQGTANMNGKNGCHDYSLIVRSHFIRQANDKPELAVIEAIPIQSTHMQPVPVLGREGARRIAILNGLAAQFDHPSSGSRGVRFLTQDDGSGLFCTQSAEHHPMTRQLCTHFDRRHLASAKQYRRAVASCGAHAPTRMIAKVTLGTEPQLSAEQTRQGPQEGPRLLGQQPAQQSQNVSLQPMLNVRSQDLAEDQSQKQRKRVAKLERLKENPSHWPVGMPLAWLVPDQETPKERHTRWKQKRYSIQEVETLLRKRGLIQ